MTPRSVSSPKKFLIGAGLFDQVGDYLAEHGDHVFIIGDRFFLLQLLIVPSLSLSLFVTVCSVGSY